MSRLWSELKSDEERAEYLRSGKAHEHGIIAPAIQDAVAEAFEYRANNINSMPGQQFSAICDHENVSCCFQKKVVVVCENDKFPDCPHRKQDVRYI